MVKIEDLDLYGLLDVAVDATEKQLLRAYRKKALKCHPDKNPDNPKAAEQFHELKKALEILTDAAARAAYDKALKAKKAAQIRHRELDSKRKKLKEDLESRERAAQDQRAESEKITRTLAEQIERLRKEGSRLVEEEQAKLLEEVKREKHHVEEETESTAVQLCVRWKAKKKDPDNGGYTQDLLTKVFQKYGELTAVLMSSKKCGSAIVEFESIPSGAALAIQTEIGLPSNPLRLRWISGQPGVSLSPPSFMGQSSDGEIGSKRSEQQAFSSEAESSHDFESLVLHRMRQAEERKRLTDEMKEADEDT